MFKCSHAVLSMIFGILGKFGIGIGNQKISIGFFSSTKNRNKKLTKIMFGRIFLIEKKSWLKNFWSKKIIEKSKFFRWFFFDQKFFDQLFFRSKNCRPKKYFSTKNYFRQFFVWIFRRRKKSDRKFLVTYSDAKFPQDSKNHT